MKSQCDADVARARREAQLAKESAQQALEFDRSRAEQTIANALSKERTEKLQLQRDLKETADRLNREWASKLRHLEIKVKNAEESKKIAVERATERLKRAHAADLAASVREATMAASKAAMEQKSKSSTNKITKGSTSASVKDRVMSRDNRRAGGGNDIMKREEESELVPLSADELNLGVDADVGLAISGVSGGGGVGGGGAHRFSQGDDNEKYENEMKLLRLKLKNSNDEASWLRGRVGDLETMVSTMRVAMKGSLEDGAGEREFAGWRQVISVKYPWMRDVKREDPKRHTFQTEKRPPFVLDDMKKGKQNIFASVGQ